MIGCNINHFGFAVVVKRGCTAVIAPGIHTGQVCGSHVFARKGGNNVSNSVYNVNFNVQFDFIVNIDKAH